MNTTCKIRKKHSIIPLRLTCRAAPKPLFGPHLCVAGRGGLRQVFIFVKRPSKKCKTPYVGDVIKTFQENLKSKYDNNEEKKDEEEYLLHTPCLGCGGLRDAGF